MPRAAPPCIIAAALLCTLVPPARAQGSAPADTTPFRPRQWGAELTAGPGLQEAGLLRFRSRTTAWTLDLRLTGATERRTTDNDPFGGGSSSATIRSFSVATRLGLRRYAPISRSVLRFVGGGVQVAGSAVGSAHQWDLGLFGQLGAAAVLSPRFLLGASGGVDASYRTTRSSSFGRVRSSGVVADFGLVSLSATVLF